MNREARRRAAALSVAEVEARLADYRIVGSAMNAVLVIFELWADRNRWVVPRRDLAELWSAIDWSRYEISVAHEGLALADACQRKYIESAKDYTQWHQLYQLTARGMKHLQDLHAASAAPSA